MKILIFYHSSFLGSIRVGVPVAGGSAGPLLVVPGEEDEEHGLGRDTAEHRDTSISGV